MSAKTIIKGTNAAARNSPASFGYSSHSNEVLPPVSTPYVPTTLPAFSNTAERCSQPTPRSGARHRRDIIHSPTPMPAMLAQP